MNVVGASDALRLPGPLFVSYACVGTPVPDAVAVTPATAVFREAREPQVAVGDAGATVYVAFGAGNAVYCAASRNAGKSYAAPVKVAEAGMLSLGMRRGPRIAVAGKAVVISAIYGAQGRGRDGELLAWRSTDGGRTWRGPSAVSDVPGTAREGLHAMAASPDGRTLACAWLDLRAKGTQIFASFSRDGGATWSRNVRVYASPDGTVCECCHPSLAFDARGNLLVMWRNWLGGSRDMYLARSDDGGKTFGPAQKLGSGTWPLNACPMDGGMLAVGRNGAVTTFWRRDQEMFLCAPGAPRERSVGRGQQGWAADGPGGTYAVWLRGRPGALYALTPDRAEPFLLAEGANDPVVAAVAPGGQGTVVAAWTVRTGRDGETGILAVRLDPTK